MSEDGGRPERQGVHVLRSDRKGFSLLDQGRTLSLCLAGCLDGQRNLTNSFDIGIIKWKL